MTKIGEFPVQRSDGAWDDIELYELGTFDHEPLVVQLSDGRWGTPYLQSLGEGDTGLLVQASDGTWYQVNRQGILMVEDWESGTRDTDTWNWENTDFTGTMDVVVLGSAERYGDYSFEIRGFARTISMPSYPNPLEHYPGEGDTIEYHFRIAETGALGSGQQYWFHILVQDCPHHTTTAAANTEWDGGYTIEAIMGDSMRIQRRNMDGTVDNYSTEYLTGINWSANTWYKVEAELASSGPVARLYEYAGSDTWTLLGDTTFPEPLDWSSGGIGMRGDGDGWVYWDNKRLLP